MMNQLKLLGVAIVMMLGLSACATTNNTSASLPLAGDKPTFLFFYTDNWSPWMRMQPIVNGLQAEFDNQVEFLSFNALDNADGEAIFAQLGLRGHPSILIYAVDGQQAYQGLGIIDEEALRGQIENRLSQD